ncbi:hypothetical protein AVEN_237604-1 [Araneus ventricosus]|uniref:Uncharacterized protein n=1 Tax=Araneus ventricosus TaxID=182803 RepID=A0A4Y2KZF6_ARAVE|nr:hypothetical protein AVEN_237604-1 [Araneus ventricosus]
MKWCRVRIVWCSDNSHLKRCTKSRITGSYAVERCLVTTEYLSRAVLPPATVVRTFGEEGVSSGVALVSSSRLKTMRSVPKFFSYCFNCFKTGC